MSAPELKPCPFCGSKNVVSFRHIRMHQEPSAMCRDCFGSATAVSKWNRRADLAPAAPKVKALVPGFDWCLTNDASHAGDEDGPAAMLARKGGGFEVQTQSPSPARAWLLAILKAYRAQDGKGGGK